MWAFDPVSGDGAKRHGGRFNRPKSRALYTSLDYTTAWIEAQQSFPFKPQPMTLVAYEVDCNNIVNLNDPTLLDHLGYPSSDLSCAWEYLVSQKNIPPTWKLVDQLKTLGANGIKVRSFASGCTEQNNNLILWNWSDSPPNAIRVIDNLKRLPKTNASWR